MNIHIGDTVEITPENPLYTRELNDDGEWEFVPLQRPPLTGTVTGIRDTILENEAFREYHIDVSGDKHWYHSSRIKPAAKPPALATDNYSTKEIKCSEKR